MKCNTKGRVTEYDIQHMTDVNERTNMACLNYMSRLVYVSLHENAGFGCERMRKFCDNAYDVTQDYIKFYTADDAPDWDYAVDSYYGMRRDLLVIGYDPETELWQDTPFGEGDFPSPVYSARDRELRRSCLNYANTLSFYTREMVCGYAIELHQTNGFGVARLKRVLDEPARKYLQMMRWFLARDKQNVRGEMKRALDAYNGLGYFSYTASFD